MLQRRRRTACFQVEKLEGRAAPSIIATSAVIDLSNKRFAHIYGHTTSPTVAGETLEIIATEHRGRNSDLIETKLDYTVVASTSVHGHTGHFSAFVETANRNQHFYLGGKFTVFAVNITSRTHPHVVERTETRDVHVRGD
jgi:hypothetical protein